MVGRLAPGFLAKVASDRWGLAFSQAVEFYVAGNLSVPIEVGIILAQSGLDLLAWSKFVRSGRVAPSMFEGWPARERFRRLLTPVGVPASVPARLTSLSGPITDLPATADVFDRIATVRNRIVHPPRGRSGRKQPAELIRDTWRASLYFLELSLLSLSGYHQATSGREWTTPRLAFSGDVASERLCCRIGAQAAGNSRRFSVGEVGILAASGIEPR